MKINLKDYEKSLELIKQAMPELLPNIEPMLEVMRHTENAVPNGRIFSTLDYKGKPYRFGLSGDNKEYLTIVKGGGIKNFFGTEIQIDSLTISIADLSKTEDPNKTLVLYYLDNEDMALANKYGNGTTSQMRIWLEKTNSKGYELKTVHALTESVIKVVPVKNANAPDNGPQL
ncbi:MAG: hypothetical protein AB7S44_00700 [Spirochaetales bacterium]